MAEVVLENVTKVFDRAPAAVQDVSLHVAEGEFVVLVGPSGCGKSTTLRMIAGLEEVSSGRIYIDRILVNDIPPKDRDIAMVFQNYALYPHMTVYQNMAFGLKLRKYPKNEIDARVNEASEILGIQDLLDRRPKVLSGGQRQRVAVGRAIVRKPKVFLFDEPLSNLDARLRVQMRTEISKLHSRLGATMIYVTHDQVEAMTMGDRIVVMMGGVIQQIDTPLNLYDRPSNRFVAGFIGSPSMNFLEGALGADADGALTFDDGAVRIPISGRHVDRLRGLAGRNVVYGIRPEHIFGPELSHGAQEKSSLLSRVEVVEPMGNETLVYLSCGASSLVARLGGGQLPRVGDNLDIVLDISRSHFFDAGSGKALL